MNEQPGAYVPPGADTLPPQPTEAVVSLRRSFPLFPPERTRLKIIGEPNGEHDEVSLSSIVIDDPDSGYCFTLAIAGSYNIEALKPQEVEDEEPEEVSLNDTDRLAEIEEVKMKLERGGMFGIRVKTSSSSDSMLAKDGEDETTPVLTRAAIVFLTRLRFVIIRDGKEKRLKPKIKKGFTGVSFRLRYPLEDVERDEVGKIRGKVILLGRNR